MLLILLFQCCFAYQNWRNWKQAKATESVKPRSYHGKNDYRWEIAGNQITVTFCYVFRQIFIRAVKPLTLGDPESANI